jgi:hypothetical protein
MKRLALVAALAGCPSNWAFQAGVYSASAPVDVIVASNRGLSATTLAPIANAHVTCDGCSRLIEAHGEGRFFVNLGTHYRAPAPITLHVTAPGFQPLDLEVAEAPRDSQLGYASFVIVLKPLAR